MSRRSHEDNSPESREQADARVRRLTRSAILAATGATVLVGVVIAKEHPGTTSGASTPGTQPPTTPLRTAPSNPSPNAGQSPTTTTRPPVTTSGGTSR